MKITKRQYVISYESAMCNGESMDAQEYIMADTDRAAWKWVTRHIPEWQTRRVTVARCVRAPSHAKELDR